MRRKSGDESPAHRRDRSGEASGSPARASPRTRPCLASCCERNRPLNCRPKVGLAAVCTRAQLPHNELPEHGTQHTSYPDGGSCAERAPAASARALLDRRHLVRDGASPLASRAHHCSNTFLFPPSRSLGGRTFLPQKARRRCCCARRTGQTTSRLRCHSGIWSRVRRCLRRA